MATRINTGGFSGGVHAGAPGQAGPNELEQLASALGDFSGAFDRGVQTWSATDQERKRINIETQKTEGKREAEVLIKDRLAGYTSAQIGNALTEDNEIADKLKANPYILPAVNQHRGRLAADETFLSMIDQGVDVANPQAIRDWTKGNVQPAADPFEAAGFNEQWERRMAASNEQAIKEKLTQIERDRQNMGSTEFDLTLTDAKAGNIPVAEALRLAHEELLAVPGIKPDEVLEIEMGKLRQFAEAGNLEAAEALVNMKRGDAPSLLQDARVGDTAAMYLDNARLKNLQNMEGAHVEILVGLHDRIDAGITRQHLEALPEMARLKSEDPAKWGQAIEYWRADKERKLTEGRRNAAMGAKSAVEQGAIATAANFILQGRGEFIESIDRNLGEGISVSVAASTLRNEGLRTARNAVFPDGFETLDLANPENALKIKRYTRAVADSSMVDPMLQGYLQGATAFFDPEVLPGNEKYIVQSFNIYKQMDRPAALAYVTDPKQRAVYAKMDELATANPKLAPEQLAARAVQSVLLNKPVGEVSKPVRTAAAAVRILDPLNPNKGGWFGMGAGPKRDDPADDLLHSFMVERAVDYQTSGMDAAQAAREAAKDAEAEHVSVNGRPVRMPHWPSANTTMTPENFARIVSDTLTNYAETSKTGGKPEDYVLTWASGVTYSLRKPDGSIAFLRIDQLKEHSSAVAGRQARGEKFDRLRAAQEATKR